MANINKAARFWINNKWIHFRVTFGTYTNFITFLDNNNISIIKENKIDFDKVPKSLHGYGHSRNLLEYIANNKSNNNLIILFLNYYLGTLNFSYPDGKKVKISIINSNDWKTSKIIVIYQSVKSLTADLNTITADNTTITADKTVYTI